MRDLRIDGHKLMFHVERVNAWLEHKTMAPIYLEIAPSGGCNHRCVFCAVDYLKYKPVFLDARVLKKNIRQAARCGVKSVMYAGEGEPLLHPDIVDIVRETKKAGIDVSMTTNGVLLKKEISEKMLKDLSWLRVSLNAGTALTYERVHRSPKGDFGRVLENLKEAVRVKKRRGLGVTIGAQLLLIPENAREVVLCAKKMKGLGLDYVSVKPYSQHPLSRSRVEASFKYEDHLGLARDLRKLENKNFSIFFRDVTMKRLNVIKDYGRCLGLPFWAYINACGDVVACSAFLGKKDFCYGNIMKHDFKTIMKSARRREIMKRVAEKLDVTRCRQACRLDKINSYLWELKHPGPHVNFI
jgi:radical SAM protein with 4Fe4S-binding SPASM domain